LLSARVATLSTHIPLPKTFGKSYFKNSFYFPGREWKNKSEKWLDGIKKYTHNAVAAWSSRKLRNGKYFLQSLIEIMTNAFLSCRND